MKAVLLFAALLLLLLAGVSSAVCNSTTFLNPLNNACVNRTAPPTQSAPGCRPTSTTPTHPPASA